MPGIVDIFLQQTYDTDDGKWGVKRAVRYISKYFSNIVHILKDRDVHLGTTYGICGLELKDFLSLDPESLPADTVFELCNATYMQLPSDIKYQLHKRPNVMLHDYMQVLYATGKQDSKMHYSSGEAFGIPTWLLSTVADTIEADSLADFRISDTPGLALCLVNKPRPFRLDMLEELYQQNLLDEVDWTLGIMLPIVPDKVEVIKLWASRTTHPFVQRFKDALPKQLYTYSYTDCVYLPPDLAGNYQWSVCCETYNDVHFATEKTFKAFLGCMAPLTVAPAGFNKHLEAMGFQMPGDYDHLQGEERIQAIAQILKSDTTDYTNLIKHNYDLITNNTAISELIADRIVNEYKL